MQLTSWYTALRKKLPTGQLVKNAHVLYNTKVHYMFFWKPITGVCPQRMNPTLFSGLRHIGETWSLHLRRGKRMFLGNVDTHPPPKIWGVITQITMVWICNPRIFISVWLIKWRYQLLRLYSTEWKRDQWNIWEEAAVAQSETFARKEWRRHRETSVNWGSIRSPTAYKYESLSMFLHAFSR
jgi:hypothetical protein